MRIVDRLRAGGRPCFSFEFFPPKTDDGRDAAVRHACASSPSSSPGFVSVTYGAGGSTRELTVELVTPIKRETGIEAMAHLTCVGHGRGELREILERLRGRGRRERAGAARRSAAASSRRFSPPTDGFAHAQRAGRVHPRAQASASASAAPAIPRGTSSRRRREIDLAHTRRKVDAGAEFLITQLFFDNAFYFHFVERARAAGITCPIVPGHHADHQLRADRAHHPHVRRDDADAAAAGAREAQGRSRGDLAARRRPRDGAVRASCLRAACRAFTSTRSIARARRG